MNTKNKGGAKVNTTILKRQMQNFSLENLKRFLGKNLVDTLLEWTPENQPLFTKSKLTDMILTVHGVKVFKNPDFRLALLKTFCKEDIFDIGEIIGINSRAESDLELIVKTAASSVWKDSKVSRKVIQILEIDGDIFEKQLINDTVLHTISAEDRFFELLDYQFVIKQRLLNELNSSSELNRMIVHMPTGTGKTKTAMHTICHHYNFNLHKKGLILWIAHTNELLQQAFETFKSVWKHLGAGDVVACKVWGVNDVSQTDFDYNGFMFCGIQKLMSIATSSPEVFKVLIQNCSLLIFDEAHKAGAAETKNLIEKFMVKKHDMCDRALVGLTATPGRFTDLNVDNDLLASMFGNKIISIDTEIMNYINMSKIEAMNVKVEENIISYFQRKKILAKVKKEQLTYPEKLSALEISKIKDSATNNGYNDFTTKALETIGRNKSRNLTIMKRLRELNATNMPTIVFACSVEHGQLLSSMLSVEGIPNALVIGDMLPQERENSIKAFKDRKNPMNILINYEVLTTGFDSTNIKCVFIARPTQSVVLYSQMLGRGLRGPKMGGNEECLLIDIKDNLERYNEKLAFGHFDNYWKV